MNELLKRALTKGFVSHDGSIEDTKCYVCDLSILTEVRQWLIEDHSIYVQEQCFNTFNWGVRIYNLTGDTESGAPILFEEEEAEHVTNMEALVSGLKEALNYI